MDNRKRKVAMLLWVALLLVLLAAALLTPGSTEKEPIKLVMRDAVLHEDNKISLFGRMDVNPAVISAFTVTGILLAAAVLLRLFAVPRFREKPGRVQTVLEALVGFFDGLVKTNSPHRNRFLGAYVFGAGCYIFFGTCFELFGLQAVTTKGLSIALPAPLADINGAIALGFLSYLTILLGGAFSNGLRGIGNTLKDFSLPISMSFRLFGALLSGLLVTELVYYSISLSLVLPVAVGVMFTLLHALIQTYVLIMLTTIFYGEVSEPYVKKQKVKKSGQNAD